jgi:pumilio RNA-binding family
MERSAELAISQKPPRKSQNSLSTTALPNLCSNLSQQLDAGAQDIHEVVGQVRGSVCALAFDAAGCRVVQKLIEMAMPQDAGKLVMELHGSVRRAVSSPHANFVIQKVIDVLPARFSQFIAKELAGSGAETSRHRYGCRILCRLVEHSIDDAGTLELLDEVVYESSALCRHEFGHYVLETILEHGLPEQKQRIALSLEFETMQNASDKTAAYIIEAALQHCAPSDQARLVTSFLSQPESLICLAEGKSSSHVVRALLQVPGESSQAVKSVLQHASGRLQRTIHGRRVLQELEKGVANTA